MVQSPSWEANLFLEESYETNDTRCIVKTQYPMRTVTKLRDVSSISAVTTKQSYVLQFA